ncbi:alpha/beta fold hydrolase [Aquincola sp. MAHUQ-54]|uniref:Alpha/beta fold hydrolase n=1 Tax=Aquincola agrisoli TaxID=3119538 RepID=A0AAW9Q4S4_9BURK
MRRTAGAAERSAASGRLLRIAGLLLMLTALAVSLSRAPDRPVQSLVARWAPPPSDFIELDGQVVHLRDEGPVHDAVPLVLLHGLGSSLHTWEAWAAALRRDRRVVSLDLPGSGLTGPRGDGDYRLETTAQFVLAALDALKLQRVQLAGNGRGGDVAAHIAAIAPQRVDKLVLLDPTGLPWRAVPEPALFTAARLPVLHWLLESLLPRDAVAAMLSTQYADPAKVTAEQVDRSFELLLREGNRRALHHQLLQLGYESGQPGSDLTALLRRVDRPVLLMWGTTDGGLPPAEANRWAAMPPNVTLMRLPALGRLPQQENPVASLAPVRAFLAR